MSSIKIITGESSGGMVKRCPSENITEKIIQSKCASELGKAEISKNVKELYRYLHPDKNLDCKEDAGEKFKKARNICEKALEKDNSVKSEETMDSKLVSYIKNKDYDSIRRYLDIFYLSLEELQNHYQKLKIKVLMFHDTDAFYQLETIRKILSLSLTYYNIVIAILLEYKKTDSKIPLRDDLLSIKGGKRRSNRRSKKIVMKGGGKKRFNGQFRTSYKKDRIRRPDRDVRGRMGTRARQIHDRRMAAVKAQQQPVIKTYSKIAETLAEEIKVDASTLTNLTSKKGFYGSKVGINSMILIAIMLLLPSTAFAELQREANFTRAINATDTLASGANFTRAIKATDTPVSGEGSAVVLVSEGSAVASGAGSAVAGSAVTSVSEIHNVFSSGESTKLIDIINKVRNDEKITFRDHAALRYHYDPYSISQFMYWSGLWEAPKDTVISSDLSKAQSSSEMSPREFAELMTNNQTQIKGFLGNMKHDPVGTSQQVLDYCQKMEEASKGVIQNLKVISKYVDYRTIDDWVEVGPPLGDFKIIPKGTTKEEIKAEVESIIGSVVEEGEGDRTGTVFGKGYLQDQHMGKLVTFIGERFGTLDRAKKIKIVEVFYTIERPDDTPSTQYEKYVMDNMLDVFEEQLEKVKSPEVKDIYKTFKGIDFEVKEHRSHISSLYTKIDQDIAFLGKKRGITDALLYPIHEESKVAEEWYDQSLISGNEYRNLFEGMLYSNHTVLATELIIQIDQLYKTQYNLKSMSFNSINNNQKNFMVNKNGKFDFSKYNPAQVNQVPILKNIAINIVGKVQEDLTHLPQKTKINIARDVFIHYMKQLSFSVQRIAYHPESYKIQETLSSSMMPATIDNMQTFYNYIDLALKTEWNKDHGSMSEEGKNVSSNIGEHQIQGVGGLEHDSTSYSGIEASGSVFVQTTFSEANSNITDIFESDGSVLAAKIESSIQGALGDAIAIIAAPLKGALKGVSSQAIGLLNTVDDEAFKISFAATNAGISSFRGFGASIINAASEPYAIIGIVCGALLVLLPFILGPSYAKFAISQSTDVLEHGIIKMQNIVKLLIYGQSGSQRPAIADGPAITDGSAAGGGAAAIAYATSVAIQLKALGKEPAVIAGILTELEVDQATIIRILNELGIGAASGTGTPAIALGTGAASGAGTLAIEGGAASGAEERIPAASGAGADTPPGEIPMTEEEKIPFAKALKPMLGLENGDGTPGPAGGGGRVDDTSGAGKGKGRRRSRSRRRSRRRRSRRRRFQR